MWHRRFKPTNLAGLYVAGHRSRRRRAGKILLVLCVAGVIVAGFFAVKHFLDGDTSLGEAPARTTTTVSLPKSDKKHVDGRIFTLELPDDWEAVTPPAQPYVIRSWQNTAENKGVRRLDVYVDGAPQLAVNRVLPVESDGARLALLGPVSDNCTAFTEKSAAHSGTAPGKWRGVNFLCDAANHLRNVTGTSSPDGVNAVKVSSTNSGTHGFFFVYTDNSATPDFDLFSGIITSFRLK